VDFKLDRSGFTGCVPTEIFSGRTSNLATLYLDENVLHCKVPNTISPLMTSLQTIKLSGNRFSGGVPKIGLLTTLTTLDLGTNQFSGNLPTQLSNLTKTLKELWMGKNVLSGTLPAELFDLTQLTSLDLKKNAITGHFPAIFRNSSTWNY
jgi:Leucine-rich repeat (LRR) protein